jgi:hypothetical protein
MNDGSNQTSLIGDILARTKEFLDDSGTISDGFTLSTLHDIKLHAEGHAETVRCESVEWTRPYKKLIQDVRAIIVSHTDLATGSDAWHACVQELMETVALDYAHR